MDILFTSSSANNTGPVDMAPPLRKFALVAHVASSVGWLGSVATFLALSLTGLFSHDAENVRSAYLAMNTVGLLVIIPFCFASLTTGLIQSLVSPWGLFRHYWVLSKLLLNLLATLLLIVHQYSAVAVAARHVLTVSAGALPSVGRLATQLVFDSSMAALTLLAATALAIYKPKGLTAYGRRRLPGRDHSPDRTEAGSSIGFRLLLGTIGAVLGVLVMVHLTGLAGSH